MPPFLDETTCCRYSQGEFHGDVIFKRKAPGLTAVITERSSMPAVSRHAHDRAFLGFIISGEIVNVIDGLPDESLRPLVLAYSPLGYEHATRESKVGARVLGIVLEPEFIDRITECDGSLDSPTTVSGPHLRKQMLDLIGELHRSDQDSPLALEAHVHSMLGEVMRNREASRDTRPQPWLILARDILTESPNQGISLNELAYEVGIHPVHLAREFQRHFGCTPGEYVRTIRVQRACKMLVRTRKPLFEIAARTGFYDQAHFTRVFKSLVGVTPSEYRRTSLVG